MEYLCPECNLPMLALEYKHHDFDYICEKCKLKYMSSFTDINNIFYQGRLLKLDFLGDGFPIVGTFDYCSRVYKLKVFM